MKRHLAAVALIGFVGCVASEGTQSPSPHATSKAATEAPPTDPAILAAQSTFPAIVNDWTTGRWVASATSPEPHAQMAYVAGLRPRPEAQGVPQWIVHTGSPVVTTPVMWSSWSTDSDSDKLAVALKGTSGTTTSTEMMGDTGNAASGASILVFEHLYGSNASSASNLPALVGYAASGKTYASGGLLFSYPATNVQLYALANDGTLSCWIAPNTATSVEGGGTASAMTACTGFPYSGGHAVTHSSPWGIFGSGGAYTRIYFGDDTGLLHCVNAGATSPGTTCWAGHTGLQVTSTSPQALAEPLVLAGEPLSTDYSIFIGDQAGRFFDVVDNGTSISASEADLCGAPGTCTAASTTWAVNGSAGGDIAAGKLYVGAGAHVFEFPLDPTTGWAIGNTASLNTTGALTTNLPGSVILDQSSWIYVGWNNEIQKIHYPFGGTPQVYGTPLVNQLAAQNSPSNSPIEFGGSIYIGSGGASGSGLGLIEQYDCTAPGDTEAPLIQGVSDVKFGDLVSTLPISDWVNGNIYVGFTTGGTTGGIAQHGTNSHWVCPSGGVVTGVCSSGTGTTCGATSCSATTCSTSLAETATATCSGSTCVITCNAGYGNCDGNAYNGCEADTHTDADNCGTCGTVCNVTHAASATCSAGTCAYTCSAGYSTCGSTSGCTSSVTCGSCCGGASCNTATGEPNLVCEGNTGNGCIATNSAADDVCQEVAQGGTATLSCPGGSLIKRIVFASYGTPNGSCGSFTYGTCDSASGVNDGPPNPTGAQTLKAEQKLVEDQCIGLATCTVVAADLTTQARDSEVFGNDATCGASGTTSKRLYIEAQCACDPSAGQCDDGSKDNDETAVDCGGSCSPCVTGLACGSSDSNCLSGSCSGTTHLCVAATCTDGVKDGSETGVDCGGATCDALSDTCALGIACGVNADCHSGICDSTSKLCVDAVGGACTSNAQCETGLTCNGTTCVEPYGGPCVSPTEPCATGLTCDSGTGGSGTCREGYSSTCSAGKCQEGGGSGCNGSVSCAAANDCCASDQVCAGGDCHGYYGGSCPAGSGETDCDQTGSALTCDGTTNTCMVANGGACRSTANNCATNDDCCATGLTCSGATGTCGSGATYGSSCPHGSGTLDCGGTGLTCDTATNTCLVGSNGACSATTTAGISGYTITFAGTGYVNTNLPTVAFSSGTATATITAADISGGAAPHHITAVTPGAAGSYSAAPTVTIVGGGVTGANVATVTATVVTCTTGSDCCATGYACGAGNTCLGSYGTACPAGSGTTDCGAGLTCDSATNTCLEATASTCGVGNNCASGLTCTGGKCVGGYGATCPAASGATDCASGFFCDTATDTCLDAYNASCGTAAPSAPSCAAQTGTEATPTDQLVCDSATHKCLEDSGDPCGAGNNCATGYTCTGGTCKAGVYGSNCPAGSGTTDCAAGLTCDTATNTCLDAYATSCGTAAPTTPSCATGFACDTTNLKCEEATGSACGPLASCAGTNDCCAVNTATLDGCSATAGTCGGYGGTCPAGSGSQYCETGFTCALATDTNPNTCEIAPGNAGTRCRTAGNNCGTAAHSDCCADGVVCNGNTATARCPALGAAGTYGEACSGASCAAGLTCDTVSSTCEIPLGSATACNKTACATHDDCCADGVGCSGDTGTCGSYGSACPAGSGTTDCASGLTCDSVSNTCEEPSGGACQTAGCAASKDCCANALVCVGSVCQGAGYGASCPAGSGTTVCASGLYCDTATDKCLDSDGVACGTAAPSTPTCATGFQCDAGECTLPYNGDVCIAAFGCSSIEDQCLGGLCVFVSTQQNLSTFYPPAGCTSAVVEMWGGGGGGGGDLNGPPLAYPGGGGGYITGLLDFGSTTVTMSAGGAGTSGVCTTEFDTPAPATTGGGGPAGVCSETIDLNPVGGGGGESILYLGGTQIMSAGGGGGAAGGAGGVGGGNTAGNGANGLIHGGNHLGGGGGGGTTSAGGAAGLNSDATDTNDYPNAGTANQGGNGGGDVLTGDNRSAGAGGGGGWFGGGGGARGSGDGTATGGGGGGGSSYYSASELASVSTQSATGATPPNNTEANYGSGTWGAGGAGSSTAATPGQGGRITLTCQY